MKKQKALVCDHGRVCAHCGAPITSAAARRVKGSFNFDDLNGLKVRIPVDSKRVEAAPLKIDWRRVWGEFKDPHGLPFPFPLTPWDWERWQRRIAALVRWQRRIAALVNAELKRCGR
ncbi:MAG: hypothetical protein AAB922_05645 [Patescibacteria group bacterium]